MNVNVIGVPLYYGSDKKGVDLGPNKIRDNNLMDILNKYNHNSYDLGNIFVPPISDEDKFLFHNKMKFLDPIVNVNTNLAEEVYNSLNSGNFPFVIGGDHSLGLGSISGASKFYNNLAVIWVDAHGDINTDKTTNSGNVHGMPLAGAMGIGSPDLVNIYYSGIKVKPENVFIVGARDLDEGELKLISNKNLNVYSTSDIKKNGIANIMKSINEKLIENDIKAVHLSFDIDCIDKSLVPGTGTPVSNGMSIEEGEYLIEYLMKSKLVKSMDLVEFNPLLDKDDETLHVVMNLIDCIFKNMK
ncbi:arginase [Clostridium hydrogenum]|uniref:arginase n=1 Tax=Clostridium hydrogenum TaxID=2855764 RepID=UPI001F26EBB6|nr:arginase [Clostridium hydrogenum]